MIRIGGLTVLSLFLVVGSVAAQEREAGEENEKPIARAQLPAPVQRTVASVSQGATIKGFVEETEDGKTAYEVEMSINGHTRDVLISPTGEVLEVEEQVVLDSLPPAVKAGLLAAAGSGRITVVESLTKGGKLVAYEAHVTTNGRRSEVQVGPDGKKLDHEE